MTASESGPSKKTGGLVSLLRPLAKKMAGALGLRLFNNASALVIALVLANLLGADGYGAYSFGLATLQLLMIFALWGMKSLVVRETAQAAASEDAARARGMLFFAAIGSTALSCAIALLTHAALNAKLFSLDPNLAFALSVTILAAPVVALMHIFMASLRGVKRVVQGLAAENFVRPVSLLCLIGLGAYWNGGTLSLDQALYFNIASFAAAALYGLICWRTLRPSWIKAHEGMSIEAKIWVRAGLALLFLSVFRELALRVDRVMLGFLADADAVGVYTAAARLTGAADQFLFAVHMVLGPMIAQEYAHGRLDKMRRLTTAASRLAFLASATAAVMLILFATPLLGLFGEEFHAGAPALTILMLTKMLSAFLGPAGLLLTMTKYEKDAAFAVIIAAVLNVALNWLLIPVYGIMGAAIGTAVSTVVWNALFAWYVWRKIGLDPSVLGLPPRAGADISSRKNGSSQSDGGAE